MAKQKFTITRVFDFYVESEIEITKDELEASFASYLDGFEKGYSHRINNFFAVSSHPEKD